MSKQKIWFVVHPLYLYVEDVKQLARENGLKIVDAMFDDGKGHKDVPKLTLKNEYKGEQKTVKGAGAGNSDGGGNKELTVDQLKAELTAKGVTIPAGAKKDELKALLDEANKSKAPTADELKDELKTKGVDFADDATVEELQALLDEANK